MHNWESKIRVIECLMNPRKICVLLMLPIFSTCGENSKRNQLTELRPNIVLIVADDMGYGDLGCYGNSRFDTPNIDSLAAGGLRLTDYHSNGVVYSPTRASLLTGRYPQEVGIEGVVTAKTHRHTGMQPNVHTLAELLKGNGYQTALFGKWHLGYSPEFGPLEQGFDTFEGFVSGNIDYQSHIDQEGIADWWNQDKLIPENGYLTDLITQRGLQFINQVDQRPFFLYLPHGAPHYPYQGPEDPAIRTLDSSFKRQEREDVDVAYKEMIQSLDSGVGQILSQLKQKELLKNTLVIFCSDNGASARVGSNGLFKGHKGQVYEGGHRVPGIFYWEGKITPGVSDQLVLSMDIVPTVADLLHLDIINPNWSGRNLTPLLTGNRPAPENQRTVFWRFKDQKAARKGKWKLIAIGEQYALYDLEKDPEETTDIQSLFPEAFKTLMQALERWESNLTEEIRA